MHIRVSRIPASHNLPVFRWKGGAGTGAGAGLHDLDF